MNQSMSIPTYIMINTDLQEIRKKDILNQFLGRDEFSVTFVEINEHISGSVSKWNSIVQLLNTIPSEGSECILVCEENHQFTADYTSKYLFDCISEAQRMKADMLIGGASWFENAVRVSENLYWVENFDGNQFIILFRKFFQSIIKSQPDYDNETNRKFPKSSDFKMLIHPYISIPPGASSHHFKNSSERVNNINKITNYYSSITAVREELNAYDFDQIKIPTYVINLPERIERLEHIKKQFEGKDEFQVTIVSACRHEIGAIGLWQSIRKVLTMAIKEDADDVIIICEDDHQFTEYYSKELLIRNIIEAHYQGAGILAGGIGNFTQLIPITNERFWIDSFWSTQFIILFKKTFNYILSREFNDTVTADDFLSELINDKMVIFPFISVQKDTGYSDISKRNVARETPDIFERCSAKISQAIHIYNNHGYLASRISPTMNPSN